VLHWFPPLAARAARPPDGGRRTPQLAGTSGTVRVIICFRAHDLFNHELLPKVLSIQPQIQWHASGFVSTN